MRKFKGQINGVEYTDQKDFENAYRLMQKSIGPSGTVSVSYTIEETPDETVSVTKDKNDARTVSKLTGEESEILCEAVESIREIVEDTTERIQEYIDSDEQTYRNTRELCTTTDSAIMKIRWIVQSLPSALRREMCESIYSATKEMVDNIKSDLVDLRYEVSKFQENISDEIHGIESDLRSIDMEIEDLQKEKSDLFTEIGEKKNEYERNDSKISAIDSASRFFDNLIDTFEI